MDPERYVIDRERLATALRDLRQSAGLTGVEAARRARMSQPKISKLETGRLLPSITDLHSLLSLYQADRAARDELLEIAGRLHATIESNRTILRRGAAYRQARLSEIEHEATSLRYFSPVVLPGLLQTAEYMRRVFSLELSGTELARTIAARQQRQQILYDTTKTFTFVITEAALRWGFCPAEVMAAQASHIASLATLTNVEVGVISLGAPIGDLPLHGYQILDDRLARIELEHAVVTVTDPQDVATYVRLFGTMSQAAEFGQEARSRLAVIGSSLTCSR
jgi:transcriptional regulator with XRE-family HTH domain